MDNTRCFHHSIRILPKPSINRKLTKMAFIYFITMAAVLTSALGKPVEVDPIPEDETVNTLKDFARSDTFAVCTMNYFGSNKGKGRGSYSSYGSNSGYGSDSYGSDSYSSGNTGYNTDNSYGSNTGYGSDSYGLDSYGSDSYSSSNTGYNPDNSYGSNSGYGSDNYGSDSYSSNSYNSGSSGNSVNNEYNGPSGNSDSTGNGNVGENVYGNLNTNEQDNNDDDFIQCAQHAWQTYNQNGGNNNNNKPNNNNNYGRK